jgi:ferrous iron transport protein B
MSGVTHDRSTARAVAVAVIGNPNTGKSTLFNAIAGMHQHVGNYPGVTVEKRVGAFSHRGCRFQLVDLPGTYSIAPRSADEAVAVEVLLGRGEHAPPPQVVLAIVNAANLQRNLYLTSQLLETGLPVVVALNMTDVADGLGITIDVAALSRRLGVPVIPTQANRKRGIEELKDAITDVGSNSDYGAEFQTVRFPEPFEIEADKLTKEVESKTSEISSPMIARRMLLDAGGWFANKIAAAGANGQYAQSVADARKRLEDAGFPPATIEIDARRQWISDVLEDVVHGSPSNSTSWSDHVDRVLTHRVFGTLFFIVAMAVVFQSIYTWAGPVMDLVDGGVSAVGSWLGSTMSDGPLRSLLVDGVVAGVGAVLVFVPQIAILFFFIAILEDCGYLPRAAFLMDGLMARVGLNGKSFIPLLSSFACAVPGIMATRVIEDRRDRLATILVAPLMSCSARLPVYVLLIGAFIPKTNYLGGLIGLQGLVLFGMHFVGAAVAVPVVWIFKRYVSGGTAAPFVLELPTYKRPSTRTVFFRVWNQTAHFLKDAGTLIFATAVVVWALLYFPRPAEIETRYAAKAAELEAGWQGATEELNEELAALEQERDGEYVRQSIMGTMGRWIEPAVRPLGWDWKIGMAALSSFPAREVIVATLGTIYSLGGEVDEESRSLRDAIQGEPWAKEKSIPVALSIMVFFALCAQCVATLAVIKRETNSWKWPVFSFVYMTGLAYVGALVVYQVSVRLI